MESLPIFTDGDTSIETNQNDPKIYSLYLRYEGIGEVRGMIANTRLEYRAQGAEFWVRSGEYSRSPMAFYHTVLNICLRDGIPSHSVRRA